MMLPEKKGKAELLKQAFCGRYSGIEDHWSVAVGVTDKVYPAPNAGVFESALRKWDDEKHRVLVLGKAKYWPSGWTASVPMDDVRLFAAGTDLGKEQEIAKEGTRFEHRIYPPSHFDRLLERSYNSYE